MAVEYYSKVSGIDVGFITDLHRNYDRRPSSGKAKLYVQC